MAGVSIRIPISPSYLEIVQQIFESLTVIADVTKDSDPAIALLTR
jgi:hypothetical protein